MTTGGVLRCGDPNLLCTAEEHEKVIYYGIRESSNGAANSRVSRPRQRAACDQLLAAALDRAAVHDAGAERFVSFSHSRTASATAIGIGLRVGIDVEWMAPHRDGATILEALCDLRMPSLSIDAFYRAWTFYEAHFKANGRVADSEMVHDVIKKASDQALVVEGADKSSTVGVVSTLWRRDFMLTVAWSTEGNAADVDLIPIFDCNS